MTNRRILVVDDDETVLDLLVRLLERHQYSVSAASNSTEAWTMATEHVPDFVILDLILAEEDGYETLERFRAAFPRVPILILTGLLLDSNFRRDLIQAGATVCLRKCESFQTLLHYIEDLLPAEEPSSASATRRPRSVEALALTPVL
jgi:CheY-like chemotaxis protein